MTTKRMHAAWGTDVYTKIDARTIRGDGCWEYTGSRNQKGYPTVTLPMKQAQARVSRLMLARKIGRSLADGECVRHTCDNPRCINPDHLIPGTNKDNVGDRTSRGRHVVTRLCGEENGRATLTKEQAIAVLHATGFAREIAAKFGVSMRTVYRIKGMAHWSSLRFR